jgi:hypothetical protein
MDRVVEKSPAISRISRKALQTLGFSMREIVREISAPGGNLPQRTSGERSQFIQ